MQTTVKPLETNRVNREVLQPQPIRSCPVSDPVASWFVAAEQLGEHIGIRFGHIAPGESQPTWFFKRHTDFDGIGGFAHLLRERGALLGRLPQIKYPVAPSWLCLLRALPKYLRARRRVFFGPMPRGRELRLDSGQAPPAVAWHVFDEA